MQDGSSLIAAVAIAFVVAFAGPAHGDEPSSASADEPLPEHAPRRRDATWQEIFSGPFVSSRLFAMPTADVVGAFQISVSGDASLLSESGVLSSSSVVALGFGDIAQLEYRNSAAITRLEDAPITLPALGVQLKLPLRERAYVPAFAVAIRFGFPHSETTGDGQIVHDERVADLYFVSRLRLWGPLHRFTLHGGLRVGAAEITSTGAANLEDAKRNLWLPAGGWEVQMTPSAVLAGELALVPLFEPGDATRPNRIGSGVFGRAGVRWRIVPALVLDASVGYRIEVETLAPTGSTSPAGLVDWDMRLGAEIFLPWGAALCRRAGVFCE